MGSRIALTMVLFAATALTACDSDDGQPAPDAAPTVDASPGVCAGDLGYLEACTADTECGMCTCKSFGHSMVCTKTCVGPEDCPAPSGGCTAGFCRP